MGASHFPRSPQPCPQLLQPSPTAPQFHFLGQRVEGVGQATCPDLGSTGAGSPIEWGVRTWWVRGLGGKEGLGRGGTSPGDKAASRAGL